jgi:NodT family efflux transporter outer membrane factor (OMF) lipoprotein
MHCLTTQNGFNDKHSLHYRSNPSRRHLTMALHNHCTWRAVAVGIACALSAIGCATHASIATRPEVPAKWDYSGAGAAPVWPSLEWYRSFGSTELDALIVEAASNNLDIAVAAARLEQAEARARVAGASILPQLNAGADVAHFNGRAGGATANETDWSTLLSASYEVDFWGKNRAAANAGSARARASRAERETVSLTILTSVVNSYFQVLSLRERLAIAQSNLETGREVVKVIQARYVAGAAGAVELATQRATVAASELAIPDLAQQEVAARGALALLVGRNPEDFRVVGLPLDRLTEPQFTPGLPAMLLSRRPDLLAAEANLQTANADVAAARAALLPTVILTSSGGAQNPAVRAAVTTLAGTGAALTVGTSLVQTIFDGGRRQAVRAEAEAKQQELVAAYRGAILAALLDVETALAAIQHLDMQQPAQLENGAQSDRAFQGAQLRYRAGSGDYLSVLESQRLLYAEHEQQSTYRLARLRALVGLCKALGGGWRSPAGISTP